MPATLVEPSGAVAESKEKQLERLDKEIAAVKKRKLITVVDPGSPDKVMFVEPFDLRGKDPEEDVEIIENYVINTDWSNGFAQHNVGRRSTGKFQKRGPTGPFGPTYRIDTTNQGGKQEYEDFKRVLNTHTSRLSRVPEPVPYHSDVNNEGVMDLKTITISPEDVPVAFLENYKPLQDLIDQRAFIAGQSVEETSEGKAVVDAQNPKCDICGWAPEEGKNQGQALSAHKRFKHGGQNG